MRRPHTINLESPSMTLPSIVRSAISSTRRHPNERLTIDGRRLSLDNDRSTFKRDPLGKTPTRSCSTKKNTIMLVSLFRRSEVHYHRRRMRKYVKCVSPTALFNVILLRLFFWKFIRPTGDTFSCDEQRRTVRLRTTTTIPNPFACMCVYVWNSSTVNTMYVEF